MKDQIPGLDNKDFSEEAIMFLKKHRDIKISDAGVTYKSGKGEMTTLSITFEPTKIHATSNGLDMVVVYSDEKGNRDRFCFSTVEATVPLPYVTCTRGVKN